MSGESESVDYSGQAFSKLAQLKERLKSKTRERPSICPTVLKPTKPLDPMEEKCKECFENNEHDTYFCKYSTYNGEYYIYNNIIYIKRKQKRN